MTTANDPEDVVITGVLAKVRNVEDAGAKIELELVNGLYIAVETATPFRELREGQVVIYSEKNLDLRIVSSKLWPSQSWIGVVKAQLADGEFVVDIGGKLRRVDVKKKIKVVVGNTVEGKRVGRISSVLSEEPISYLDLGEISDQAIAGFRRLDKSNVTYESIGGYKSVVERARELVELPLKRRRELEEIGVSGARGGLFTGDPGTGKTLLARAIANEAEATFYEVSGPQVLSKWYGQSEELLRKIFEDAARRAPSIIFFDEIDSIAGERAGDSHEVSKKVVAQLLTSMDGFNSTSGVVVIATTNRPEDIDLALLRPGRLDWVINFPSPDETDRLDILEKTRPKGAVDVTVLSRATAQSVGWSPAELAAIWTNAGMVAAKNGRTRIDNEDFLRGFSRVTRQRAEQHAVREGAK